MTYFPPQPRTLAEWQARRPHTRGRSEMREDHQGWRTVAEWHRLRAEDSSPFWVCRACSVERRFHGHDGHTTHWFVPPAKVPTLAEEHRE